MLYQIGFLISVEENAVGILEVGRYTGGKNVPAAVENFHLPLPCSSVNYTAFFYQTVFVARSPSVLERNVKILVYFFKNHTGAAGVFIEIPLNRP